MKKYDMEKIDRALGFICGVSLTGILTVLSTSSIIGDKNRTVISNEVSTATSIVVENVKNRVGIANLDIKSAEIQEAKNGGLVSFYGEYLKDEEKLVSVVSNFYIDKYLYKRTIDALNKVPQNSNNIDSFSVVSKKKTNLEITNYEELLNCLNLVVNSEYLGTQEIGETEKIENAINNDRLEKYHVLNVSQVYYSKENASNFFYVDTVCETDYGFNFHRARVEVFDEKLSSEEIYAKFLLGEQDNFVDITNENSRKKVLDSLSVVSDMSF